MNGNGVLKAAEITTGPQGQQVLDFDVLLFV